MLIGKGIRVVIKFQRLPKNRILRQKYRLWKEKALNYYRKSSQSISLSRKKRGVDIKLT